MILETDSITPTESAYMPYLAAEALRMFNDKFNALKDPPSIAFLWWDWEIFHSGNTRHFMIDREHRTAICLEREFDQSRGHEVIRIMVYWIGKQLLPNISIVDILDGCSMGETLINLEAGIASLVNHLVESNGKVKQ